MRTNQHGDYLEIATRIRDELSFHSASECQRQHRDEWPQLWTAIDDLMVLVNQDHPPREPSPPLFDPVLSREGPGTGVGRHG